MSLALQEMRKLGKTFSRLLYHDLLQQSNDGLNLEDDRYLLQPFDSKRHIASIVELHCAQYVLVQTLFFKDFYAITSVPDSIWRLRRCY